MQFINFNIINKIFLIRTYYARHRSISEKIKPDKEFLEILWGVLFRHNSKLITENIHFLKYFIEDFIESFNFLENKHTGGFRPKYGYDVDENGYLVPCEKEQSVIRLMKILRKKGNSYKSISEKVTKATRKKFPQSWVFNILKRESTIPPNEEIIRHNICNTELQSSICVK